MPKFFFNTLHFVLQHFYFTRLISKRKLIFELLVFFSQTFSLGMSVPCVCFYYYKPSKVYSTACNVISRGPVYKWTLFKTHMYCPRGELLPAHLPMTMLGSAANTRSEVMVS